MKQEEFIKRFTYDPISDLLGEGGFGRVYKAYDNYEHEYVALKIQDVDPRYPELRLKNEVEKVQRHLHKNVARYKGCFTMVDYRGETDVAIMKYYNDGSLDKLLHGKLSHAEKCELLVEILEGIAYLHSEGIIHRDLKPQNVLIVQHEGRYWPLITDFGISKQLDEGQSSAVSNSVLGGTRAYASPEQLKERTIRKNTDLWSFGVIAYQMLVGALPFDCGSFSPTSEEGRQEQFRQMMSGLLPEALNGVPEPWQRLIRECLTVDNEKRIAHAENCLAIIRGGDATAVEGNSTKVAPEPIEEPAQPTTATRGVINGHEWVDLGLPSGLKWATCNVGASNPGDYGNYYAWGEISTKSSYTEDNCATWEHDIGDRVGPSSDAACANWGGSWRMPNYAEIDELLSHCTWTWTTQNGHNGYKVTGPNGNSIFLPAAGYRGGTSSFDVGSFGGYWSSTPDMSDDTQLVYYLSFDSGHHERDWDFPDLGQSVRPVSE